MRVMTVNALKHECGSMPGATHLTIPIKVDQRPSHVHIVVVSRTRRGYQQVVVVPGYCHHEAVDLAICFHAHIIRQHRSLSFNAVVVYLCERTRYHVEVSINDSSATFLKIVVPQVVVKHISAILQHEQARRCFAHFAHRHQLRVFLDKLL